MTQVDVVVPCYNYGRYLERCVKSVLDQPGVAVRVLIIDDCSTDETMDVGQRLAASDRRITYRRHATNHGHIATYNEGLLDWVTGDYCLLISADDVVAPGAIVRAALVLDHHPKVGLCYGHQIVFADEIPAAPRTAAVQAEVRISSGADFWYESCRTAQNVVSTPTAVVRTSIQQRVGGYKKDLPHTADFDIWLRIAGVANVAAIDATQAFKRMHGENMQVRHFARPIQDLQERWRALESALADCRANLPDAPRLGHMFRRALSLEAFWAASAAFEAGQVALYEEWLTTARDIDPTIVRSGQWRRLKIKERMGVRLWTFVQPWVSALRE